MRQTSGSMIGISKPVFAALCVIVPSIWGVLIYMLSNMIEGMVRRHAIRAGLDESRSSMPPLDYHI